MLRIRVDNYDRATVAEGRIVKSYGTDRTMFERINDPSVNFIFYGGHSNLGGNIAAALAAAPPEMRGSKVLGLWMCKGKQNVAGISQRFPEAHIITTGVSPPGNSGAPMLRACLEGFAARHNYDAIRRNHWPTAAFLYPHDRSLADYRDVDGDGVADANDPWYTWVHGPPTTATARDAVLFANTVFGYNVEYGHGEGPLSAVVVDAFEPAGWFDGPAGRVLDVREDNGHVHVRVNRRYAARTKAELGCLVVYELSRWLHGKAGAPGGDEAAARSLMLAAELIAYTTGGGAEADAAIQAVAAHANLPRTLTYAEVTAAIDLSSYVQQASVDALLRVIAQHRRRIS